MSRALRGDLNRVLNAESANLQRAVERGGPPARRDRDARGGRPARRASRRSSGWSPAARRETPEATLAELAERLAAPPIGRPARARADRATCAVHDDRPRSGAEPRGALVRRSAASGMIRAMRDVDRGRQLEDEHDPRRRRRAGRGRSPRGRASPASSGSSARRSSASPPCATRWPSSDPDVAVGAQNVHHELAGAYTGEISAPMLAGLATWVIVGHSERRRDAGETDELIGRKLEPGGRRRPAADPVRRRAARGARGRDRGGRRPAASSPARSPADDPARLAAAGLVIAYEPVWAIGTGRNASGPDAAAMADAIRAALDAARLGAAAAEPRRSSTAAASRPRTSASSWPSRRSTARSSAAPR